jgi:hypothetical protein
MTRQGLLADSHHIRRLIRGLSHVRLLCRLIEGLSIVGISFEPFSVVTIAYDSSSSSLCSVSEPSCCIFRSTSVMSSTSPQTSRLTKTGADC